MAAAQHVLVAPEGVMMPQAQEVADEIRAVGRGSVAYRRWHGDKGVVIEGDHDKVVEAIRAARSRQIHWRDKDESGSA